MFEDSLVITQVRHTSSLERWTALASTGLQFTLIALVIALPFLHPEKLAFKAETPRIFMPSLQPPIPIQNIQTAAASSATTTSATALPPTAPRTMPRLLPQQSDDTPPITDLPFGSGMTDGMMPHLALGDDIHKPRIAVIPAGMSKGSLRISSGVSDGMLIAPIRPIYPEIARTARVEGTVVVEAIISRAGTIESLHVISGPPTLQRATLDAIRAARYQPYLLNGSPTEVQTTISVNFRLGS